MLIFLLMFNMESLFMLVIGELLLMNIYMEEEFFFSWKMTDVNFWMLFLVLFLYLMMLSVNFYYKLSLNLLFILLFYIFLSTNFLYFFIMYEMIFVFIMFTIMLLGYSYERLMALYLMMFYSFLFSSPVMMMFILFDFVFLMKNWLNYSFIMNIFLVASFMVKFPIFGFHYWLPIAHVEASTIGSMLLAGILLKLGCVGLIYLITYLNFMMKFHWLAISVLLLMLMILNLSDLKMMIAYSSIAHMSMVFYVLMLGWNIGKKGVLIMMLYHGFISPLMFWLVGLLGWYKTRSLMVTKFLIFSYFFLMMIFILMIMNMAFPPFMGFLSEVCMLKSLIMIKSILYIFIFTILFSCYYNIYLFWAFNGVMGWIFKLNFFMLDMFMFMIFVIFLNF